ncbi:response regulator [Clostridium brassicae]|uniref:Stage 0 sporulation protein A homolog n=1 Tax=Clostridium brassicae TaxID=2999072 RepID=A0ABT4DBX4_9CLOT|nr:response regulator [Clostridium brassicae]MCY6959795.1 response regulator [Clostridium brassicae]
MYTVLHIEQSDFFCKMIKNILKEKDYDYISTDSFSEAYQLLNEYKIDLIITSLYGKGDSIEDFIKNVNYTTDAEIPIFVVTSNNVDDQKKNLLNLGISDYILKDDLEKEITKHIDTVFRDDLYMQTLKKMKVAIIDDNAFESTIEKDILTKYGVEHIDSYKSGKQLFQSNKKYDIYLIDMVLENEFGKNLIRQIRRNNINSSIIAVTVLNNPKTLSSILDCGADDFITKPVEEHLFVSKLKSNIRIYTLNKKIKDVLKEMKK